MSIVSCKKFFPPQTGGSEWFLQELGPLVDASNPIHYDEIRLLREDCRNPLQVLID